jgi:hypothetical protein
MLHRATLPLDAGGVYHPPPLVLSYRGARTQLEQYDGARTHLRVLAGAAACLSIAAIPSGTLALSVFVVHEGIAAFAVGLVSLCTAWLPGWAYKSRLWERPVRARLARRTAFDPSVARICVNITERDVFAAWSAIRGAGLVVEYTRTSGPVGADQHNTRIAVAQWAYRAQVDDLAFRDLVCDVLRPAGISANVGGIEVNTGPS